MSSQISHLYYYMKYLARSKIREKRNDPDSLYENYAGRPYWDMETLNRNVASMIESGKPFMMARFGAVELFNMRTDEFHLKKKTQKALNQLYTNAGFFPNDCSLLPRFNQIMKESCRQTDVLGVWQNCCEDYYMKKYCTNLKATAKLIAIEPWRSSIPWSSSLKGKKVLVIHPFEDSIRRQYKNFDKLFPNPDILPKFELKTLKAVQTAGDATDERFRDWFEALDYMSAECEKTDFDIALLGCGAYGFPLAAKIKKMGRQAVHLGGCLQILFGIKGDRWDNMEPDIVAMYNDYWHYPLDCEIPDGSGNIEGNTYWKK